jgi:predicted MFS family arabinose efflux permease
MTASLAVITCPCHLPLVLPIVLGVLAGTPIAAWITQHVGWVYGGMAVVFLMSLLLMWRWIGNPTATECKITVQPDQGNSFVYPSIQSQIKEG